MFTNLCIKLCCCKDIVNSFDSNELSISKYLLKKPKIHKTYKNIIVLCFQKTVQTIHHSPQSIPKVPRFPPRFSLQQTTAFFPVPFLLSPKPRHGNCFSFHSVAQWGIAASPRQRRLRRATFRFQFSSGVRFARSSRLPKVPKAPGNRSNGVVRDEPHQVPAVRLQHAVRGEKNGEMRRVGVWEARGLFSRETASRDEGEGAGLGGEGDVALRRQGVGGWGADGTNRGFCWDRWESFVGTVRIVKGVTTKGRVSISRQMEELSVEIQILFFSDELCS